MVAKILICHAHVHLGVSFWSDDQDMSTSLKLLQLTELSGQNSQSGHCQPVWAESWVHNNITTYITIIIIVILYRLIPLGLEGMLMQLSVVLVLLRSVKTT